MINKDKYHSKLEEAEKITRAVRAKQEGLMEGVEANFTQNVFDESIYIAENAKLNKEIEKLKAENEKLRQAMEEATAKYADAMHQGERLLDECDEVKAKLEDRENVIADLQKKNKDFTKEINKLKKAIEALSKE